MITFTKEQLSEVMCKHAEEDNLAMAQIKQFYPDHKVFLVPDCLELVRDGGALNCVTWTILDSGSPPGGNLNMPE